MNLLAALNWDPQIRGFLIVITAFTISSGMFAQFLFLPYAPVWSVIMIGIDFFVIWALAVYRPEARA